MRAWSAVFVVLVWGGAAQADPNPEEPRGAWSDRWVAPSAYESYLKSRIHYEAGRLGEARREVDLALAFDDASSELRAYRALLRMEQGDFEGAQADLSRALQDDPRSAQATLGKARLRAHERDWAGAARLAGQAARLDPELWDALRLEAEWWGRAEQWPKARRSLETLAQRAPHDPQAQIALGDACQRLDDHRCAQKAWSRAVELQPEREGAYVRLAGLLERRNEHARAYEVFSDCTRRAGASAECWFQRVRLRERVWAVEAPREVREVQRQNLLDEVAAMGDALSGGREAAWKGGQRLASLQDPALLETFVGRCAWRDDELAELNFLLGALYEGQGALDPAARSFLRVPAGTASFVEGRVRAGRLLGRAGRWREGAARLEEGLREAPEAADLYLALSDLWEGAGQRKRAFEVLERGVKAAPKVSGLHEQLGRVAQELGQRGRAISALGDAARLRPDDPGLWQELGDLCLAAGRDEEAQEAWRQALGCASDEEQRVQLERRLAGRAEVP